MGHNKRYSIVIIIYFVNIMKNVFEAVKIK